MGDVAKMEFWFLAAMILALFAVTFVLVYKVKRGFSAKKALRFQLLTFATTMALSFAVPVVAGAIGGTSMTASDGVQMEVKSDLSSGIGAGIAMLGAAVTFGLSALGAGMALANSTPAAIAAMSENPKTFGKSLVLVALAESLPILGMIVALIIITKF